MEWKNIVIDESITHLLQRLDDKLTKLNQSRPLSAAALNRIKVELAMEWTYNSNSIEGNTLTLQETKLVLQDGITVKGKPLREHFEAVNHHDAVDYIESIVKPNYLINEHDVLHTHALVLDKIEKDFAGRFRNAGVRITGANYTPPNAHKVYDYMHDLMRWVNEKSGGLHPIIRAAVFHHRFVWIHPFFDGNGRSVRLLFNLLMMKHGFPPAIILRNDRKKYYAVLNKANEGDYQKLFLLVCQAMERSIDIYLSNLDNYAEHYKPIGNIVNEGLVSYGYSQEYISLLARRGEIDAYKEGRVWYTTQDAINNYVKGRKRMRKTGS
jgi:Fic family protein